MYKCCFLFFSYSLWGVSAWYWVRQHHSLLLNHKRKALVCHTKYDSSSISFIDVLNWVGESLLCSQCAGRLLFDFQFFLFFITNCCSIYSCFFCLDLIYSCLIYSIYSKACSVYSVLFLNGFNLFHAFSAWINMIIWFFFFTLLMWWITLIKFFEY